MLLIVLIVLLLILAAGAGTYPAWGANYPAWGRDALWMLAIIALGGLIVALVYRGGY